jgi:diguanylate cyclase (GGDEF)-like protein
MQPAQRILLVDDERFARQLYADYLRVAGHTVETVESAEAAVEALSAGRFDLVITDMVLPGEDGLSLLARVKAIDPDCAVIVITALPFVDPAVRAIKSGAADYLVKPVTAEGLQLAVARAMATRDVLREHAQLKRGLALLENCQRLLTARDPTRLPEELAGALRGASGALAVAILAPDGPRLLGFAGALEAEARAVVEALPAGAEGRIPLAGGPHLPRGFEEAVVVPVPAESGPVARAALIAPRDRLDADALDRARFVAENGGLALANASRLASARDLAYVDDLTGLFNARYLDAVLDREIQEAAGSGGSFALLFLDLDLFKRVNDQHGHLVGSRLLVECGRVIRSCVREDDVASRWGGDEFVVLLRRSDSGGALKVAERIRRAIEGHAFLAREGLRIRLTTCVGVAAYPEHATDKDALLDLADRAMYRGKGSTRNVVYVATRSAEGRARAPST